MPQVGFVVNPRSGGGAALQAWRRIESKFPEAKCYQTTGPGDGTKQAQRALEEGCEVVAAVGGDGTVSEVGHGLVRTEAALAVVPAGTGNDYARTLNLPTDHVLAAEVAFEGKDLLVDVGLVEGHRHFLNIAGVGFDAEVMTRFNSPGRLLGKMPVKVRYYASILQTFSQYKGVRATLKTEVETFKVQNLLLLAIGCARFYGAGMHILPTADLTDGLFDLAWGHDVKMKDLNKLMSLIYKGQHVDHPNVKFARCKEATVSCDPPAAFHLDGDVVSKTPVKFVTVPRALRVRVP